MMTLDQFKSAYLGKTVGYPNGQYVGECLSLVKWYIKDVFGITPPPSGSNSAYGYWSNFPSPLGTVFEKISNTPTGVPKPGDIIIWNTNAGGGFGHIAIFLEGTASSFKSLDQNWNGKETHIQGHYYTNVVGWLTPKVSSTQEEMSKELQECLAQHKDLIDQLEAQKKLTTTAQTALGEERIKHQETKTELDLVKKELDDEEDEHTSDLEKIAVLLNADPVMSAILPAIETCITYEDKANKADKALIEAKQEYETNLAKMGKTLEDLEKQLIAAKREIERLKEEKPDSGSTVPTKSIWDLIVEFFTRKQL